MRFESSDVGEATRLTRWLLVGRFESEPIRLIGSAWKAARTPWVWVSTTSLSAGTNFLEAKPPWRGDRLESGSVLRHRSSNLLASAVVDEPNWQRGQAVNLCVRGFDSPHSPHLVISE